MQDHLRTELALAALEMVLAQRRPDWVIHRSDQGSPYTSVAFGKHCRKASVRPSMGSVDDCHDNALCESFFPTLECELLAQERFATRVDACTAILYFIEDRNNTCRGHVFLTYISAPDSDTLHKLLTIPSRA